MKAYRRRFALFNMLMVGVVLTAMVAGVAVYMYRDYYDSLHDTMAQVVKPLSALSGETADADPDDTADNSAAGNTPTVDSGETTKTDVGTDAPSSPTAALPPEENVPQQPFGEQPLPQAEEPQPSSSSAPMVSTGEDAPPAGSGTPQLPEEAPERNPGDAPQQSAPEQTPQPPEDVLPSPAGQPAQKEDDTPKADSRKDIAAVVYDPESDSTAVVSAAAELDDNTLETVLPVIAAQEEDFGTLADYGLIYYRSSSSGGAEAIALTDTGYIGSSMADLGLTLAAVWLCAMACFLAVSIWLSKLAVRPMEQSVEREKQFVADVSHDLKTPLAVIAANNSILLEDSEVPVGTLRRWVDSTGQAAPQMQGLVDEMLTLAAAQRGNETPPVPVNLSDVVEKAALQLESVAYEKQVSLETEIAAHITVLGSTEVLQRIAASLMENAIKYEPSGGSVAVRLTAAKRQVRLEVRNGGAIIPPETLPHVFDRFYRGEKSRSPMEGHGLGLAIVKQLTENLGGSITVRSSETEGMVFLVTLPGKETT